MPTAAAHRRKVRKELRLMQTQSTWLQKALFALNKAEDAREKLLESRKKESDDEPWVIEHEGESFEMDAFEEAIENRIQTLLDETRERRKAMR